MSVSETITVESSCGTQTLTADLVNTGGTEISQLCASQIVNSTCNGGNLPGLQQYIYVDTVTLIPCSDWVFSWATCCRSTTVNVPTSSGDGIYIEATLNSSLSVCNNSPVFTSQPVPSFCANQQINYLLTAQNSDGDSLLYSFISAINDLNAPLTYTNPYSGTNPINGIVINATTGLISFYPTTIGNYIVTVLVSEYDSGGNLIGAIMRDVQFIIQSCTNAPPNSNSGSISGLTGAALQTSPNELEMCAGGSFTFNLQVSDTNSTDVISLSSDITSILPGGVINAVSGNPASATISWNYQGNISGTKQFMVYAADNACPVPGIQAFIYTVNILPGTFGGLNDTICGLQQASLSATGGTSFQWSVVSGDPIVTGTNFSCNPCANPIASPDTTTTYVVTSNLSGTCTNTDTVVVAVVPSFNYAKTQTDSVICLFDQVQFSVTAPGTNSFHWTPTSIFNNSSLSNPTAFFSTSGTQKVYFTITSLSGCAMNDSMTVMVSNNPTPVVFIDADTTVCLGLSTQLNVISGNPVPQSCGLITDPCLGFPSQITVGTDSTVLSNTTYPAPYGNWYMGSRHQILYTASELNSLGFYGGLINSLAFNIAIISGTTTYKNFEIKMGCASINSLTTWQNGLNTVFQASTITIAAGWNTHNFNTSFGWDGSSNIVVEICYNNQPDPYTYNSPTYYTPTSFPSVIWYNADQDPNVCSSSSVNSFSPNNTYRPNIKFFHCSGSSGTGFAYSWSPGFGLNDSNIPNPIATISSDATYTVIVTDTIAGCSDTASIYLDVVPAFTYTKSQTDSIVCSGETVQFTITPSTGTYTYQWFPASVFSNPTINNPVVDFDSGGVNQVFVDITSSLGCTKSDSMEVLVSSYFKPDISILADTSVCSGSSIPLNLVNGVSSSACSYLLKMFDSWGDGWNGASFKLYSNGSLVGSYTFSTGDSSSANIPVTNGDSISIEFTSGTFPSEESYILFDSQGNVIFQDGPSPVNGAVWTGIAYCPGSGFTNHTFSWTPSSTLNNPSISNPVAAVSNDITYTVVVTDTIGNCGDTASIFINAYPSFTYALSQTDSSVCENDSIQFSINPDTVGNYTYLWYSSGYFNDSNIADPVGIFDSAGYQYVFVDISSGGCSYTDSLAVSVSAGPIPVISGDSIICKNESAQLSASGGITYYWSPSTGLNNTTIANPIASPSNTTNYIVAVTNASGCTGTGSITVFVNNLPNIYLGADTNFCNSILLNAGNGYTSYLWSTGSNSQSLQVSNSGTYSVSVKNIAGCTNSDTIVVTDTCGPVGIFTIGEERRLYIYPNPSKGKLQVEYFNSGVLWNRIIIFNILGDVIINTVSTDTKIEIDLRNSGSGVYFLRIEGELGTINRKIVIEN